MEEDKKYEIDSIRKDIEIINLIFNVTYYKEKITRTGYNPYTQEYLSVLYNNVTTLYVYIEETNKWDIVASLECKDRFDSKATYVSNITFNNKDLINKTDTQLEYKVNNATYLITNNRYSICLSMSYDVNGNNYHNFSILCYETLSSIPHLDLLFIDR